MPQSAEDLWRVWNANHKELGDSTEAKDAVIDAIEKCRDDTLILLQALD